MTRNHYHFPITPRLHGNPGRRIFIGSNDMNNDTFTFAIRRHLLGDLLTQVEKLGFGRVLFGFQYCMTDPWPAEPVMAWSLAAYMGTEDEASSFINSIPIIRAMGGNDDQERAGVLSYRYGLLSSLRALWEQSDPAAVLFDLTVRVRDDVSENTLEPSAMICHCP
jgi:hypothetical protein